MRSEVVQNITISNKPQSQKNYIFPKFRLLKCSEINSKDFQNDLGNHREESHSRKIQRPKKKFKRKIREYPQPSALTKHKIPQVRFFKILVLQI